VQLLRLEGACAEPTKPDSTLLFGDVQCVHLTPKAIRVLRDRKKHVPEGANNRVKALRRLFAWAIDEEVLDGLENPTRDVAYLKGEPGGFHSWTPEEVEQFEARHPIGTKARLAMALLLYTGNVGATWCSWVVSTSEMGGCASLSRRTAAGSLSHSNSLSFPLSRLSSTLRPLVT